ncbi:hypothetical protein [Pseudomonas sp.]|uniref:hypothetical protein n=1 Tax=Pseudomonas sp. TaxID=306 RepID=UPI0032635191
MHDQSDAPMPKTIRELIAQGRGGMTVQEMLIQKKMDESKLKREPVGLENKLKQQIEKDNRP